jgi:hypothetical protein
VRKWTEALLKVAWGAFLALTSLYCLLAFLPYTYYSLIKAPAYSWVPWFVRHHALLYWMTAGAAAFAYRPRKNRAGYLASFGIVVLFGIFASVKPFLAAIGNTRTAYWGAVVALWAIVLVASACGLGDRTDRENDTPRANQLSYTTGVFLAAAIALLSAAGAHTRIYSETRAFDWHISDSYSIFQSVATHVVVAVILISILNLARIAAARTARPKLIGRGLIALLVFGVLWGLSVRFLESALSFEGWAAHLYAA